MGNATSMFNLMRNIGGSMGIASATTFLYRRQQLTPTCSPWTSTRTTRRRRSS